MRCNRAPRRARAVTVAGKRRIRRIIAVGTPGYHGHVPRPFVSVLTPTFQGEAFVASTIESVLAQTYEPVEHILVDDGSTDGTPELLEDYQRRYPDRVRVLRFDSRNGPCRRRNQALAE